MKELSLGQNIQLFSDDKFKCISFNEKVCILNTVLLKSMHWVQASIGSDNGLMLKSWQAIIGTNDDPVH